MAVAIGLLDDAAEKINIDAVSNYRRISIDAVIRLYLRSFLIDIY